MGGHMYQLIITLLLLLPWPPFPNLPDGRARAALWEVWPMADGDITSVVIDSTTHYDGWTALVTIEGYGAEAANVEDADFDFGTPGDTSTSNFYLNIVSEGYTGKTLGTITRTVYGTKVLRKVSPDGADLNATNSSGDLVLRVALSEYVYNDDKDGGAGTSGTDPTATIAADWFDDGTNTSNAVSGGAVTNNSTIDYPKPVGGWAYAATPLDRRVEADFSQAVGVFHGHGVAAVEFNAVGASSAEDDNEVVTTQAALLSSKSGLYQPVYSRTVDLSAFTQGENITQRFRAYPTVGDENSILDSEDDTTLATKINGKGRILATCDKTGGLKTYGVVTTGGNDTTGAVSTTLATAEVTPYASIGEAIEDGATVIYVRTGTHDILGSVPGSSTARDYAVEVRPHPSDDAGGVILNRGGTYRTYKQTKLAYIGFESITFTSGNGWLDGEDGSRFIQFVDCDFTASGSLTVGPGYRSAGCWYINCTIGNTENIKGFSGGAFYHMEGCVLGSTIDYNAARSVIACSADGVTDPQTLAQAGLSGAALANARFNFNQWTDLTSNARKAFIIETVCDGGTVVGNVIEYSTRTSSQPALTLYADTITAASDNWIVSGNTIVGNRCNLFYNDTGTAAVARTHTYIRGNSFQSFNIKSDLFGTPNGNRIGNWVTVYGCGVSDNRYDGTEGTTNFVGEYDGVNTEYLDGQDNTFGTIEYVDDQGADGSAGGNGDYAPDAAGNLIATLQGDPLFSFDQFGNSVERYTGAAGAVQLAPVTLTSIEYMDGGDEITFNFSGALSYSGGQAPTFNVYQSDAPDTRFGNPYQTPTSVTAATSITLTLTGGAKFNAAYTYTASMDNQDASTTTDANGAPVHAFHQEEAESVGTAPSDSSTTSTTFNFFYAD